MALYTCLCGENEPLFRLMAENVDGMTIDPVVPDNFMTRHGFENGEVPRICFAPSIDLAIIALGMNCGGMDSYVYVPEVIPYKTYLIRPGSDEVPDADITHEVWLIKPTVLHCIGKIRIGDTFCSAGTYLLDGQPHQLWFWNYRWIERKETPYYEHLQ